MCKLRLDGVTPFESEDVFELSCFEFVTSVPPLDGNTHNLNHSMTPVYHAAFVKKPSLKSIPLLQHHDGSRAAARV